MKNIIIMLICLVMQRAYGQNTFLSSGPAGVNTTAPVGNFQVKGDINYDGSTVMYLTNNATDYGRTNFIITGRLMYGNDGWQFGSGARNSIVFAQNEASAPNENVGVTGSEKFSIQLEGVSKTLGFLSLANGNIPTLSITQNGRIGINTPYPQAIFDIAKPANDEVSAILGRLPEGNSFGGGTYLGVKNGNTNAVGGSSFSLEHRFYGELNSAITFTRGEGINRGFLTFATNDGTEKARLDADGSFCIGTKDSKNYKLAVNGSAIFTKAVIKNYTNWPDYVFDSSYQLPSLDSVSTFIQANKHLPDMPSAATVEKDGHDLGEVQKQLLKKVEELTLYVIQLQKQNEVLKTTYESLSKDNQQIKELNSQLIQYINQTQKTKP